MAWFLVAAVVFLVVHQAMESVVCACGDRNRRKFAWDVTWLSAGWMTLAAAWVAVVVNPAVRSAYGAPLFIATPVLLIGSVFCLSSARLAFERGDYARLHPVEDAPELPRNP